MAKIRQSRVYDLRQGDIFSFEPDIYKSTRYTVDEIEIYQSRANITTTRRHANKDTLEFDVWEITNVETIVWIVGNGS